MSKKITFNKLIEELSEQTNTSQTLSNDFVSKLTDLVIDTSVKTGKASITNLGSFKVVEVAARNGVNPQTGEVIVIPSHRRLSFFPYKSLENSVNAPFANLEATFVEEEKIPPSVFKNQKKESDSSRLAPIIFASIVALLVVVVGVWFFFFRGSNEPQLVQQTPTPVEQPVQTTTPVETSVANSEVKEENANQSAIVKQAARDELPVETGLVDSAPLGTSSHVVEKGEWFYDIARNTYKIPAFWPLIFEANFSDSQDPDILKPDKILAVPSIENPLNPTFDDRTKLSKAALTVSKAYSNAGKTDKALAYEQMARRFQNNF
ncbi:MAG: hypothetical protein BalsKO_27570 [Balneolaceae bacterium]